MSDSCLKDLKELLLGIRRSIEILTELSAFKRDLGRLPDCNLKSSVIEAVNSIESLPFSHELFREQQGTVPSFNFVTKAKRVGGTVSKEREPEPTF